jgi:hypothetical protein
MTANKYYYVNFLFSVIVEKDTAFPEQLRNNEWSKQYQNKNENKKNTRK